MHKSRRNFFKVCGAFAAALSSFRPAVTRSSTSNEYFERVQLTRNGKPIGPEDFKIGQSYIFNYPYVTTPCMIFNLGEATKQKLKLKTELGSNYVWPGGSGPSRSIVSYSAICAHQMTYPAREASFINFRNSKVVYFDANQSRQERKNIIYCCSERSVYDPQRGAQVLGGPAPQPLATILLDYDQKKNCFYAIGSAGGNLFDKFLEEFEFRLQLDFKINNIRKLAVRQAELYTIEEYSENIVYC